MIGVRIGGYTITSQLGEGGMGAVWIAENERLGKRIAVKVLLPQFSRSPQIVERFEAEARAASAIRHPNIIDVLDVAQLDDGRLYISMEFLEGCSLEEFIQAHGQLTIQEALQILVPALDGLQTAHDAGIIHRDLKPANLFLVNTPENPRFVKLLDFGIAKVTRQDLAGGVKTGSHVVLGTPGYMSFEQARGSAGVDQRSDVYAMGVITYQMLTGRLPYNAISVGDLVAQQLRSGPPSPEALRPDLPGALVDTIRAALATEPNIRPQSARSMAISLIDATPNGADLARLVSPRFFLRAGASERTVEQGVSSSAPPAAVGATVSLKPQSTLSRSSGQQYPADSSGNRRRWPFVLASIGLLAAIGVLASVLARLGSTASEGTSALDVADGIGLDAGRPTVSAAEPPAREPPDAAAPETAVLHVRTDPPHATIRHGNAVDGAAPVDLELAAGTTVEVVADLPGYAPVSRQVTVHGDMPALVLALKPLHHERSHHRSHSKAATTEKQATKKTRVAPTAPLPNFDPDAPGG